MSGLLALLVANIIWGAAPPVFKYALTDIPPFTLAFIRFFAAALLFIPFMGKFQTMKGKHLMNIIWGGVFGIALNISLFFLGLKLAPSINVHVISSVGSIVLYFLSISILKEKPHAQVIKGMLISLAGILVIIFAPIITAEIQHDTTYPFASQIIGNLFFTISMFGAVAMVIFNKKVAGKVNTFTVTSIQFLVGSIIFFPFMIHELQTWSFSSLTPQSWVGIIYGVVFSSAIAYFLHNYALTKLSTQQVGILGYISPIVAVMVAIPLLGEYPDVFFIIGAIFVFIGIFISESHPHYRKMHKKLHEKAP